MKKVFLFIGCWLLVAGSSAQTVTQKIQKAFQQFENDSQLKHAISSLYVIDAKTGQVVFDKNAQAGLAPASTQKIITSVTAFELLGKDYRYKTELGYDGNQDKDTLIGNLYVIPSGDPTFGSSRYATTNPELILNFFNSKITSKAIKNITGSVYINEREFETQTIPDGWIWQDIGNYYGTGSQALNWKENQYDLILRSGKNAGDSVKVVKRKLPRWMNDGDFFNELKAGKAGSGDNAYGYFSPRSKAFYLRGTIPPGMDSFPISVSMYSSAWYFYTEFNSKRNFDIGEFANDYEYYEGLQHYGGMNGIEIEDIPNTLDQIRLIDNRRYDAPYTKPITVFASYYSPSLDSIIYWFNKKSINLYGEALIKTFAYEKQGFGSTNSGVAIVKKFWKDNGLDEDELNIYDGSGLSPLNRVTTHAQVKILKYAKTKDWFQYFYNSLPDYNGMKMKSGTISDVKGFCGYHKAKDGKEYIFSFLVNNYSGKTSGVVNKMYKVLDELK